MRLRSLNPASGTLRELGKYSKIVPKESKLPPTTTIVSNAAKSVVNNVVSAVKGNRIKLTQEESDKRMFICHNCEFYRKVDRRCGKCGCYLAVKTYLKAERCPVGKW